MTMCHYLSCFISISFQCLVFCVLWDICHDSSVVAAFTSAPSSTRLPYCQKMSSREEPLARQRYSLLALQASTLSESTQQKERSGEIPTLKSNSIQSTVSDIERFSSRKGIESTRLAKARLLLEQLQTSRDETEPLSLVLENGDSQSDSSSSTVVKSNTELTNITPGSRIKRPNSAPIVGSLTNVVVPDTYWSNGHLDDTRSSKDSLIVTRWARGVKVAEPLVKYDPIATEKKLFRQPAKWFVRNIQIAFPLGFWAVSVVFDFMTGRQKNSESRRLRAQQLTKAISSLGPAIIKGGQALASRPDLLPSEYLQELQKLQDDVPRFENSVAFRTVEEELGIDNFYDVFELVESEPIAAASIGQVYKAILRENGATVALKIQRPDCETIIALDLYVLRWWSGIYNTIFTLLQRDIDLQSIIDDFGELIYREIDYVAEAANAQRFNELYAGVTDIFVPKVYSEYTTNKVLTMEWVDGVRLTDQDSMKRYNLDESKLVDSLVQCSLRQILGTFVFRIK
jgi:ABC1 atypical kinase-like domain